MIQINKFLIAIPFYRNEEYLDYFVSWYRSNPSEHKLIQQVLVINDDPAGNSVYLQEKCIENKFEFISNELNLGYLKTANIALHRAIQQGCHLILLNSDTIPYSKFVTELAECFDSDPNLGVIAPRSNNATICNLYNEPKYLEETGSFEKFIKDFNFFRKLTPKVSYVPTATGFCFCIRSNLLSTFGGFDPIYGGGYEEENDYCMRVSERGIRIGIANHAFVAHMEGKSFGLTSLRESLRENNKKVIASEYPYYPQLINNYASSLDAHCIRKISQSLGTEGRLVIDASSLTPIFNGTNKLIAEFVRAINEHGYEFDMLANKEALKFHGIDKLPSFKPLDSIEDVYQVGIRIGQPFNHQTLYTIPQHSVVSICIFFDVIAHDCPQLLTENSSIDEIWTALPYVYSDISFISSYAKDQFFAKFGYGSAVLNSDLLPIDVDVNHDIQDDSNYDHDIVLVIGNKFKHKAIDMVFKELPSVENRIYYVLAEEYETGRDDVKFLSPGHVEEAEMANIMRAADFFVFPTFSEGFGFPILEAIQYGKVIYCRALLPFIEISNSLDKEQRKLIKFVPNFKLDPHDLLVANNPTSSIFFADYLSYVDNIIKNATKVPSEDIYRRLKNREFYLRGQSSLRVRQVTVVFLNSIYSLLIKIPHMKKFIRFFVRKITI